MSDWNPASYGRFTDQRLQPALDLLARLGAVPDGDVVDLGCGSGAVGPALAARFDERRIIGVDNSPAMLAKAEATGAYASLTCEDIGTWSAEQAAPSIIFSNAALQWLGDHQHLMPRLAGTVAPGGVLAVQMPFQNAAPSHQGWGAAFTALFGNRAVAQGPDILSPEAYFDLLSPLGDVSLWETHYLQHLPAAPGGAHPVRLFTESTFARPFLEAVDASGRSALVAQYEAAMAQAYPLRSDGSVLFAFRRLFFILRPEASR
ncbi:methyltransferase domain-containing protein [Shimia sp.]|uniref:methyltransferase domain-containing protein n=1 Tax=Shimia sp. TaxID=1954381 RepID=UPI0032972CB8